MSKHAHRQAAPKSADIKRPIKKRRPLSERHKLLLLGLSASLILVLFLAGA